jgi:hypothetical protein
MYTANQMKKIILSHIFFTFGSGVSGDWEEPCVMLNELWAATQSKATCLKGRQPAAGGHGDTVIIVTVRSKGSNRM